MCTLLPVEASRPVTARTMQDRREACNTGQGPTLPRSYSRRSGTVRRCNPLESGTSNGHDRLRRWTINAMAASHDSRLAILTLVLVAFPAGAWNLDCQFSAERTASLDTTGPRGSRCSPGPVT